VQRTYKSVDLDGAQAETPQTAPAPAGSDALEGDSADVDTANDAARVFAYETIAANIWRVRQKLAAKVNLGPKPKRNGPSTIARRGPSESHGAQRRWHGNLHA